MEEPIAEPMELESGGQKGREKHMNMKDKRKHQEQGNSQRRSVMDVEPRSPEKEKQTDVLSQ
jgi:hypothetical protein